MTFWLFVCITSFYLSLTVILTSHFSNITYFRQQQQQNKPMKYYEILPTHTETPRNTTRKIANVYIEFNYQFLTLQKKIPLLLNRSVQTHFLYNSFFMKELLYVSYMSYKTFIISKHFIDTISCIILCHGVICMVIICIANMTFKNIPCFIACIYSKIWIYRGLIDHNFVQTKYERKT